MKSLQPWKTSESTNQPTGPKVSGVFDLDFFSWVRWPEKKEDGGKLLDLFAKFGVSWLTFVGFFVPNLERVCRHFFPNYGSFVIWYVASFEASFEWMCSMFLNIARLIWEWFLNMCLFSVWTEQHIFSIRQLMKKWFHWDFSSQVFVNVGRWFRKGKPTSNVHCFDTNRARWRQAWKLEHWCHDNQIVFFTLLEQIDCGVEVFPNKELNQTNFI